LHRSCAALQQQLRNVLPPETRRQAERFSVQRVRCRTAIEQEARGFEVASVDGEHERQAVARVYVRARVQQETQQLDRPVRRGDA
jgi:hypothetical protein